jgi:hypothetical protein
MSRPRREMAKGVVVNKEARFGRSEYARTASSRHGRGGSGSTAALAALLGGAWLSRFANRQLRILLGAFTTKIRVGADPVTLILTFSCLPISALRTL